MTVDNKQLLTLSLIELDKVGSLCAQLWRSADSSSKPLLHTALESLQKVQTLLVGLHTSEHETLPSGETCGVTPE